MDGRSSPTHYSTQFIQRSQQSPFISTLLQSRWISSTTARTSTPPPPLLETLDCYPALSLASAIEAATTQIFDPSADLCGTVEASYWGMVGHPGPMADPWCNIPIQDSYGKHHDHRLVDWRLTRAFRYGGPGRHIFDTDRRLRSAIVSISR